MKLKFLLKNKITKYSLLSLLAVLFCSFNANAQQITVKGIVTDSADSSPIPGVSVLVKGTKNGTTTDFDGNYSIKTEAGKTLVFAYLGMKNKEVRVAKSQLNVSLESETESLDEIVVIGYGAVKKKELTGAVAQVKSEAIEQFVTTDIASAMQGQVAGVSIVTNSGEPGEQSSIQIRGITSLTTGANSPLWVVDGIPQVGNPGLNMNEIETFDILKDGASTAVYGSRGAAGVILVTTKKGKEGVMQVNFKHSIGLQYLGENAPLMNAAEQIEFEKIKQSLGYSNHITILDNNPTWYDNDNDFSDYVLNRAATTTNYSLNVSGGTDRFTYNFSGGYLGTEGALVNSYLKRYNARASTSYKTDRWKINTSLAFTIDKNGIFYDLPTRYCNGTIVSDNIVEQLATFKTQ